jgi:hypothetical protein
MTTAKCRRDSARRAGVFLAALAVAVSSLAAVPVGAFPQGRPLTMTEALSGNPFPLTRRLGDLDSAWRRFWLQRVPTSGGTDPLSRAMLAMMEQTPILLSSPVYYSRGETVRIEGKAYLLAYVLKPPTPDPEKMQDTPAGKMPVAETRTPDTLVHLALIDVASIRGMDGIRAFDLQTEIMGGMDVATNREILERARASAINTSSLSNLKQIGTAMVMYAQDYDEVFPPLRNPAEAKRLLMPYIKSEDVFVHPGSKKPYVPNPAASRKSLAVIERPVDLIVFYEPDAAPDGTRGAVFADGHAKRLTPIQWQNAAKYSQIPASATPK